MFVPAARSYWQIMHHFEGLSCDRLLIQSAELNIKRFGFCIWICKQKLFRCFFSQSLAFSRFVYISCVCVSPQPTRLTSPLRSVSRESSPVRITAVFKTAGNVTEIMTVWTTATRRPNCAVRAHSCLTWNSLLVLSHHTNAVVVVCPSVDQHTCPADRFKCQNNRCIPMRWLCDGDNDCGNDEDESNTTCSGMQRNLNLQHYDINHTKSKD